jgi:hypothetical protein
MKDLSIRPSMSMIDGEVIFVRGVELGIFIIEIVTGFQNRSDIIINLPTKRLSTKIWINCSRRKNR